MTLEQRFQRVYTNLPLTERVRCCVVYKNEPMSWRLVRIYVDKHHKIAEPILEIMGNSLKLI